jgi:hypothetical protein
MSDSQTEELLLLRQLLAASQLATKIEHEARVTESERFRNESERFRNESERFRNESERFRKEAFLALMLSISSSGSGDTASHADEKRRGAPLPQRDMPLDDLLPGNIPQTNCDDTLIAWKAFVKSYTWTCPKKSTLNEDKDVHPTIKSLIEAAMDNSSSSLRLWCNVITEDDIPHSKIKPDFSLTHKRDAMPSTIGSLLLVEVKLPGKLKEACSQARTYLRRSIHKRCVEANERGERMDNVFALALATDGMNIIVLKMLSGAPPLGSSFVDAVPCLVFESPALPLLLDWDFLTLPQWDENNPSPGFILLRRLCTAPPTSLSSVAILTQLNVQLNFYRDYRERKSEIKSIDNSIILGNIQESEKDVLLHFTSRLGCGGSSDAFACSIESNFEVHGGASHELSFDGVYAHSIASIFAKVARFTTLLVQECFERERVALLNLRDAAKECLVPTLIATGKRVDYASNWPLLLLMPCGIALNIWVSDFISAKILTESEESIKKDISKGMKEVEDNAIIDQCDGTSFRNRLTRFFLRKQCATIVSLRILDALEIAHSISLVHCDVRPSNIVIVQEKGAMLIDWGISRNIQIGAKINVQGCGVAAYSDRRIFEQGSYNARPVQDVIGLLLTWLCILYNEDCTAPWSTTGSVEVMFDARETWLNNQSKEDKIVDNVVHLLQDLSTGMYDNNKTINLYTIVRESLIEKDVILS